MKTKTYILTFFIFFSGVVFGQKEFYGGDLDGDFLEFIEKVYSLECLYLDIKPIKSTDTISLTDKNGMVDKYKLKYVSRWGNAPSFEEFYEQFIGIDRSAIKPINTSYTCLKYGTDYIVIKIARTTSTPHSSTYYYEIIRKEE